jgi:signal transduction histidine kinase
MNDPTTLSAEERDRYVEFDRTRGLRLSRIVGFAFAGACAVALSAMGLSALIARSVLQPAFTSMGVALLVGIALYCLAAGLAQRGAGLPAAALIAVSTVLVVAAFQIARESVAGVDSLVAAAFAAYTIPIGLSGVVGSPRLMFVTTAVITGICGIVGLVLPTQLHLLQSPSVLVAMVGIASGVHWLVALLIFGASSLYIRTMHELGDIRGALERARQLDALKDQFITHVNHELRTPIMALRGYVELLRLRHETMSVERRTELLEKASLAGNDLIALVTSILDEQQLEHGLDAASFQPVNLYEALQAAVRLIDPWEGQLVERELRVRIPEHLTIQGEPVWVRQVFINLLSNAIKYSVPGAPVEVTAESETEPSQVAGTSGEPHPRACVRVHDQGLGVPPEQAPLLFNRFTRLPRDLASNVIGNGLGLYLCRILVEAMGGRIWVESSGVPGEGSTFAFTLPMAPQATLPASLARSTSA